MSPEGPVTSVAAPGQEADDNWHDLINPSALDLVPPGVDPVQWYEYRAAHHAAERADRVPAVPVQIDLELNGGCNMACPFCTHGYERIRNVRMPRRIFEDLIGQALDMGVRSLKLNYINEPMLRPDLEELIRWSRDAGMLNIYFVTNGSLLKPHRRRALLESGLTKLFVSLDAVTAETYGRQRLNGQFERIVENVEAFIRERRDRWLTHPIILVSFLINRLNQHETEQFRARWADRADVVSFQRMNEVPGRQTGLTVDHTDPPHGCKFPLKQIVVTHRGDILPCCKLAGKELRVGNVADMSLREAWDRLRWLRELHVEGRWAEHPVCSRCMRCQ